MKKAFTMIELVFVMVILGILAGIALPKFGSIMQDTYETKGITELATIRSTIARMKQDNLLQGKNEYPDLNRTGSNIPFANILPNNDITISTTNGWSEVANSNHLKYNFNSGGVSVEFTYVKTNGSFTCNETSGTSEQKELCKRINN